MLDITVCMMPFVCKKSRAPRALHGIFLPMLLGTLADLVIASDIFFYRSSMVVSIKLAISGPMASR